MSLHAFLLLTEKNKVKFKQSFESPYLDFMMGPDIMIYPNIRLASEKITGTTALFCMNLAS